MCHADGVNAGERSERGATALEYGLIAALIVGALLVTVPELVDLMRAAFDGLENSVETDD